MKKLLVVLAGACLLACTSPKAEQPAELPEEAPVPVDPGPVEIADPSTADICKAGLVALASGDVDGFTNAFADQAMWRYNSGDSIVGKEAITKYWKDRRANVIDRIAFSKEFWLAVNVNTPPNDVVLPGKWVFGWFKTDVTYKGGKTMTQWIHNDYHLNSEGKIDLVIQYLDRLSVAQAMPKK